MPQTGTDDQGSARVAAPIALIINAPQAQEYLEDNEVLSALFGQSPRRICIMGAPELLYPKCDDDAVCLAQLRRFPDVPNSKMLAFVESDDFYEAVAQHILDQADLLWAEINRIRVIIAEEDLFGYERSLGVVCQRYFDGAQVFSVRYPGHGTPKQMDLG